MKISDHLTRAFYAVAGRDAEYVLANTSTVVIQGLERGQINFDWREPSKAFISLPVGYTCVALFHELSHAYHIHHWPVVSHFCAVERCEEAALCLTWMAAHLGVLRYEDVREHDQAIRDPRQRDNMLVGVRYAFDWYECGWYGRQRRVNAVIRGILHADLR